MCRISAQTSPKSLERKREERKGKPEDPAMCLLEYFPIIYLLWLLERAKLHVYQLGAKVGWVNQTPPEIPINSAFPTIKHWSCQDGVGKLGDDASPIPPALLARRQAGVVPKCKLCSWSPLNRISVLLEGVLGAVMVQNGSPKSRVSSHFLGFFGVTSPHRWPSPASKMSSHTQMASPAFRVAISTHNSVTDIS